MVDLVNDLQPVGKRWYRFGLNLRIPQEDLEIIESDNTGLKGILQKWTTSTSRPTWRKVVTALQLSGLKNLADTICTIRGE